MRESTKQRLLRLDTQAKFPFLVELTYIANVGTETIYRYANCDSDVTFENHTFNAGYFVLTPPEKKQDSISDATISISAIDQTWIDKIRSTRRRAKIRFVGSIEYNENNDIIVESLEDYEFELTNAKWGDKTIQWTMKFDEGMKVIMPCETCSPLNVPALG